MSEYSILLEVAGKKLLRKFETVTAAMDEWQIIGLTRVVPGTRDGVTAATLNLGGGKEVKMAEPCACLAVP